jgi:hypothetical protein
LIGAFHLYCKGWIDYRQVKGAWFVLVSDNDIHILSLPSSSHAVRDKSSQHEFDCDDEIFAETKYLLS